jgi:hypothetical protein
MISCLYSNPAWSAADSYRLNIFTHILKISACKVLYFQAFHFASSSVYTLLEMRILSSYRMISGIVTIIWLIQSGEGVMIAAMIRMATNAYLRRFLRMKA